MSTPSPVRLSSVWMLLGVSLAVVAVLAVRRRQLRVVRWAALVFGPLSLALFALTTAQAMGSH